ncbi:hypothetical protein BCR32DRAFT_283893 [Anaeromyces robustus]|uniref:Uncharacterized protein n=1 Tax=Anaeromyces robustus TaxID=1754192 RepID=A0A1Y1WTS9_9FUNG|nr:hypothetical protein BCR32DRAFT_283893 [Anaeromyces robustus]|eukprot:ORX76708.1 hypothetical protein BCR32DRAFT_283893 [Anaeromyces robustus]
MEECKKARKQESKNDIGQKKFFLHTFKFQVEENFSLPEILFVNGGGGISFIEWLTWSSGYGQIWSLFNRYPNNLTKSVEADNSVGQDSRSHASNNDNNFPT